MLIFKDFLPLLGTYLGWAGGAFAVLYADQAQREPDANEEWGLWHWAGLCLLVGPLTLPFYFWSTRATASGLATGIMFGILVVVVAFFIRLALSVIFEVPLG